MISIIVTFKMDLKYLRDCLESIAVQEYHDIETILVSDHTTEDITALAQEYEQKINLSVYELEDGKTGVSAARNLGLEKASGEYLMFLDSDDFILDGTLKSFMDVMEEDTDIVYAQLRNTRGTREAYIEGRAEPFKGEDEVLEALDFNDYFNYCIERYKVLEKLTILACLYRASLWKENGIRFDDALIFYADVAVMAQVFSKAENIKGAEGAVYIKRHHNDKVNNPSLLQYPKDETMSYYIKAYKEAIAVVEDEKIEKHLNLVLAKFISRLFPKKYRGSEDDKWRGEYYDQLLEISQTIDKKYIKKSDMFRRNKKYVFAFMKGDRSKIGKISNRLLAKRKMNRILTDKRFRNKTITLYFFNKMSLKKNWVVFESFMGRNYSGQPKYIYQYMQEHCGDKYRYIWIVDKRGIKIGGNCKKVKRWSLRYFYYMNRSKYWVLNMRQPLSVIRREETVMLQTWHGTPLKKLAFDLENIHSYTPKYKENVFKQTRGWDYMLSDNPYSSKCFTSAYMLEDGQILEAGYPANDPMYAEDKEQRAAQIRQKLGIPADKKVILYAPTWRDDQFIDTGEYGFELDLDVKKLQAEFSDRYVLLMRLHYLVVEHLDMKQYGDFTIDVCNYDDITDLYLVTDLLITDYSSVFFDFANLKRPMLFYMYDLENYRDNLHGFYLNIEESLPGPILQTNEEVCEAIRDIENIQEAYAEKYQKFYDEFCCLDDGHAAERVVDTVFQQ